VKDLEREFSFEAASKDEKIKYLNGSSELERTLKEDWIKKHSELQKICSNLEETLSEQKQ